MQSYVFYDVDNKEVDVEDSLNYLSNRLETLRILWDYGMVKGFSNAVLSSIDEYIESILKFRLNCVLLLILWYCPNVTWIPMLDMGLRSHGNIAPTI